MNRNRYEIFLKVVEIGNITRAAEVLHYTQAGVSHAVAALEHEAGVPLLVRSPNGVTLTENGRRLLAPIQTLVNDQRSLQQAMHEINEAVAGTLRLGIFTSIARWLPVLIKNFQEKYPLVEFELQEGDYEETADCILNGKLDCGFTAAPVRDGLQFQPIYHDRMLVILPPEHPLAGRDTLTLPDLREEPFILPTKGSDIDVQAIFKQSGERIYTRYRLNDDFTVLSMVANGFGVALMPELIVKNYNIQLTTCPLTPLYHRTIGIASLPLNRASIVTRTFVKYLSNAENLTFLRENQGKGNENCGAYFS